MRSFVTFISTFALVAHFTLGCCLHHAECREMAPANDAAEEDVHTFEADGDHDADHDNCPGQKHAPHGACKSVPCAALRVHKAQAPDISASGLSAILLPSVFVSLCELEKTPELLTTRGSVGESPPLHLLHQVFLI